MTSTNLRSEYWVNPSHKELYYRSAVERVVDAETGAVIKDRDINRNLDYGVQPYAFMGLRPSEWYYKRPDDYVHDEEGEEEFFAMEDADFIGLKKLRLCEVKKFLDYKGPWPT